MTNRMPFAVCAALLLVGAASAQTPPAKSTVPPPVPEPIPTAPTQTTSAAPLESWTLWEGYTSSSGRFWAATDYLFSWMQGGSLPALVTTSPAGTARAVAGVLGQPTTTTVNGSDVNDNYRSGFRVEAGYWFDANRTLGVEAGFLMLESQATASTFTSDGTTILARPYIDATTNLPQAVLVAFPGSSSGSVAIQAKSGNFYEAHADIAENILDWGWFRWNGLLGYRYFRYDEGLHIHQTLNPTDPNFVAGTQIVTDDDFGARNEFHGGDFGFRTEFTWGSLAVNVLGKLAVGNLYHKVTITGSQVVTAPGAATTTSTAGLLALQSNTGPHGSNDFSLLPEFGINLSWQARPYLRLRAGYNVLFLTDIARSAAQIDLNLNPGLFPNAPGGGGGPSNPAFNLNRTNFSIQSLTAGVEFTY
jgi:hypothetical protein